MNAAVEAPLLQAQRLAEATATASARVAPTWPLDAFIAVNPYWGWVDRPLPDAAALGTLAGTRLTMPRAWFRDQWNAGRLQRRHLHAAAARAVAAGPANVRDDAPVQATVAELLAALQGPPAPLPRLPLVTDLRDRGAPPRPGTTWTELVTDQVSQHCAAFFDRHQARWTLDTTAGLDGSWRRQLAADHGLPWRQGRAALRQRLAAWPSAPQALIAEALAGLGMPPDGHVPYLTAVLMAVGGWAAWCAGERWPARLGGGDDDCIVHLLAIRLGWEWLLFEDMAADVLPAGWATRWACAPRRHRLPCRRCSASTCAPRSCAARWRRSARRCTRAASPASSACRSPMRHSAAPSSARSCRACRRLRCA
jgi:uncharacterized protein YbcC (UPF0753/DUF2309 family)